MKTKKNDKTGPKPDTLKINKPITWVQAIQTALSKTKPKDGWPKLKIKK